MPDPRTDFLELALASFRKQKALGDRALAQLGDEQLFVTIDPGSNSIAVIVRHLHGNMRSRWTDFLTSDGEKPDRDRDSEFIEPGERTRERVLDWWNRGWQYVFDAIAPLGPDQAGTEVRVRGEALTVTAAILRQLDHYAQHVGQIVFLAKHLRGSAWESLSIPRGKSDEFNNRKLH
jgi:hypothetical protein